MPTPFDPIEAAREELLEQIHEGAARVADLLATYPEDAQESILQYLPIVQFARRWAPQRVPWPEGKLGAPPPYLECPPYPPLRDEPG